MSVPHKGHSKRGEMKTTSVTMSCGLQRRMGRVTMLVTLLLFVLNHLYIGDAHASSTPARARQILVASGKRIYFVDGSTGSLLRTVRTKFQVHQLTWSPDRAKIAWVAATTPDRCEFEACWEVFVADADGTSRHRLTRDQVKDGYVDWSPDSDEVAFERSDPEVTDSSGTPEHDIYKIVTDGNGLTRLTSDGAATQPDWSPDGTEIAYGHDRGNPDGAIWVVKSNGTQPRQISHPQGPSLDLSPTWSPDGSRILFQRFGAGFVDLYATDVGSAVDQPLTTGPEVEDGFSWSPDGSKIAYEVIYDRGDNTWGQKVFSMNSDGSNLTPLSRNVAYGDQAYGPLPVYPTWSLDSSSVAYFHIYDAASDIWKAGADGRPRVRLTHRPRNGYEMTWGTDAKGYR